MDTPPNRMQMTPAMFLDSSSGADLLINTPLPPGFLVNLRNIGDGIVEPGTFLLRQERPFIGNMLAAILSIVIGEV
jgi:hypothetical protein